MASVCRRKERDRGSRRARDAAPHASRGLAYRRARSSGPSRLPRGPCHRGAHGGLCADPHAATRTARMMPRPNGDSVARVGIVAAVVTVGALLRAWDGFPKGVDAANHLTRLKFVSDWFPNHDWFYVWAAGMPTFDNYPGLAYVMALPAVRAFGAEPTLKGLAFVAMVAFALGLYGHLRLRGVSLVVA